MDSHGLKTHQQPLHHLRNETPPPSPSRQVWTNNEPTTESKRLPGVAAPPLTSRLPETPVEERSSIPKACASHRPLQDVIPLLPRAKTFKRQQSELRERLAPVVPTLEERRAVSMGRASRSANPPRSSDLRTERPTGASYSLVSSWSSVEDGHDTTAVLPEALAPRHQPESELRCFSHAEHSADESDAGAHSFGYGSQTSGTEHTDAELDLERQLMEELETIWILNLSMHFRDRSRREKFFVTYRENETHWRRVTVSLDYRDAPEHSLESDLERIKVQKDKNYHIYHAIRDSLADIQFYDTVTNLKLQTTDGRLHVHVVEDTNEIIRYPHITQLRHLRCRKFTERDLDFDCHMSGFVYKVRINGRALIKKEIPGPETVDEFLYEVNALHALRFCPNIISFYGVVTDDTGDHVRGLLIDYAENGALIDVIYDECKRLGQHIPWGIKERWARQVVKGLSDIHEFGFVQGDLTLSNIVVDDMNNAKIIDINRRGCPVGWEPPEATGLLDSGIRISLYIGVKSDLYQLGMVLWGLAMEEDEPELMKRPLTFEGHAHVPEWYRRLTETCLRDDPRARIQASELLSFFPPELKLPTEEGDSSLISVEDESSSVTNYAVLRPRSHHQPEACHDEPVENIPWQERFTRGRSPTRDWRERFRRGSADMIDANGSWARAQDIRPCYSDAGNESVEQGSDPVNDNGDTAVTDSVSGRGMSSTDDELAQMANSDREEDDVTPTGYVTTAGPEHTFKIGSYLPLQTENVCAPDTAAGADDNLSEGAYASTAASAVSTLNSCKSTEELLPTAASSVRGSEVNIKPATNTASV